METYIRFLLLHLCLFSHVHANEEPTSEHIKWLEPQRSLLIHLPTPDLNFWHSHDQIKTQYPGAFVFNFTLSGDNLTLLLNNEPILPRTHLHVPTRLRALQMGELPASAAKGHLHYLRGQMMDLDYYISMPNTESGTSIYNTKYNPRIRLDILRAHVTNSPLDPTPLSSVSQKKIWVWLEDLSEQPTGTLYRNIPQRIGRVKIDHRWRDWKDKTKTTTYRDHKELKACYMWSWLCADIGEYPWYEFVYQEDFDVYGKKGSLRHLVTQRWGGLVGLVGVAWATVFVVVCGGIMVAPGVYGVFRGGKSVVEMYRERMHEVDEWVADEEVEGLLDDDRYLEDLGEEWIAEGNTCEKASAEKCLKPPPPYTDIPMKTEQSSSS